MSIKKLRYAAMGIAAALIAGGATFGVALSASAHGYVGGGDSDLIARPAIKENTNLGAAQYDKHSLEGPKGFPENGPKDGQLASVNSLFGKELDEQSSTRWIKNKINTGPNTVYWTYTQVHSTSKWHYYITKDGWDQNAPLTRAALEPLATVMHDGSSSGNNPRHTIDIPQTKHGYHIIYAVWDVADTPNAFYNTIDVDINGDAPIDNEAPTTPQEVKSTKVTDSAVTLTWSPSTDNVGVAGYDIYRDGTFVGSSTTTSYTDKPLQAETKYTYTVVAYDRAGNKSPASAPLTVTTKVAAGPDTENPTAPSGVHSMGTTATSVDLMWTPSTDNVGVVGYDVLRATNNQSYNKIGSTEDARYLDKTVRPNTTYNYKVVAKDAAGNTATSEPFTVTTPEAPATCDYPEWDARGTYSKGDRVTHKGLAYEAVQGYTGNGDPNWINAPSLWKQIDDTTNCK
ncbi:lytic polysaccharide monooxygenase [Lysinibacter sp. HNR]|uniref:lytic polysaccharide monooxygenase n=1 Tax=Lysinibacter sp. HNR TaxID=3031408 RepID=UPI00243511F6|nr:lytic polysaccharide monooxygenase [Lysinibacter sp. HNR]WGD37120.1 lytic polysaccharide monooxygenase [Lysinibacter sp. HNR]